MTSETGKLQSRIVWIAERVDDLYDYIEYNRRGKYTIDLIFLEELVEHSRYIKEFDDRVSKPTSKPTSKP